MRLRNSAHCVILFALGILMQPVMIALAQPAPEAAPAAQPAAPPSETAGRPQELGEPRPAPTLAEVVPGVVASVNGVQLKREQLAALAIGMYGRQVLESLISQEVVRQEAKGQGISVPHEEVEAYVKMRVEEQMDNIAKRLRCKDLAELDKVLSVRGLSVEELRADAEISLRRFVGPELLARKLLRRTIEVTDADVSAEFESRHGPKAKVLQIVVQSRPEAEEIIKKLSGGADFAKLAQELSVDRVSRRVGGEIPPLPRNSTLGQVAFRLKPGEVSEAIEGTGGKFHVIRLQEILPAGDVKFDDVKQSLREDIINQRVERQQVTWLSELVDKAEIERNF